MYQIEVDERAVLVVPRSRAIARMLDADALWADERARRVGVSLLAPRELLAAELVLAADVWPPILHRAGVSRVAVVLSVESYGATAEARAECIERMRGHGIALACFHEGHLDSDEIAAWFARRSAERPLTSDMLVSLARRYRDRCDRAGARAALVLADCTQPPRAPADEVTCRSQST